jgi:hypothetical protein
MDDGQSWQLIDRARRVIEDGRDLVSYTAKVTELVRRTRERCVAIRVAGVGGVSVLRKHMEKDPIFPAPDSDEED